MYANAPADLAHIQRYLSGNCFGDHLTRTGLDLATRELITFSFLISLGGCDPQVKGHVRGNLNVGNDRARLIEVVTQLLPFIGYPRSLNAINAINEVIPPRTPPPPKRIRYEAAAPHTQQQRSGRDVRGDVWYDVIAAGEAPSRLRVNLVRFAPGAHTAWHRHANGQTLHVTDGVGLVGTRTAP